jgi:hypothetical protein
MLTVLRDRAGLAAVASECEDLGRHALERIALHCRDDRRFALVWMEQGKLGAVFPLEGPMLYRGLPIVALSAGAPLMRAGWARQSFNALLDWFRGDGEGAALLVLGPLRRNGPIHRAFADVARERNHMVLATDSTSQSRTLLVGDGEWGELALTALPLMRWAKRRLSTVVHAPDT